MGDFQRSAASPLPPAIMMMTAAIIDDDTTAELTQPDGDEQNDEQLFPHNRYPDGSLHKHPGKR